MKTFNASIRDFFYDPTTHHRPWWDRIPGGPKPITRFHGGGGHYRGKGNISARAKRRLKRNKNARDDRVRHRFG